jgi:branched-chain amino acid transport system permease protein
VTSLLLIQALNGLQFGLILFLIAAGLTLVFGVMDFINLAHGVQYMVGAYLAAAFTHTYGQLPLRAASRAPTALAFGLFSRSWCSATSTSATTSIRCWPPSGHPLPEPGRQIRLGRGAAECADPDALSGSVALGNLFYPVYRFAVIGAGLGVAGLLYLLVNHTRAGMLVRAGASNAPMVSALGVDIRRLFMIVFGFGAMLAGFAGAMVAPILSVEPGMGDNILILAFVVIVIGGIGSVRGAFSAALLIGLVDTLGRSFAPTLLRAVLDPSTASQTGRAVAPMLIYILMATVLFFRPSGLFPTNR